METKIDKYKLLSKIGAGGMSDVYLGEKIDSKQKVAIKILDRKLSIDIEYIKRFRKEASISKELDHPNIVKLITYGKSQDSYYIVYEYIEGITLDKHMKSRHLSEDEIEQIAVPILEGLQYAHDKNIIHRDIKPSNIMIAGTEIKILDFGIAKAISSSTITQSGLYMGSPAYSSPEHLKGDKISIKSDIYSFGILLYELLNQKLPFESDTPWGLAHKQLYDDVPELDESISDRLAFIIKKSLAKEPTDRFNSIQDIIELIVDKENKTHDKTYIMSRKNIYNDDKEIVQKKKKKKIIASLLVPLLAFLIIWFSIGAIFYGSAKSQSAGGDYLSAANNYKVSENFLIIGAKSQKQKDLDKYLEKGKVALEENEFIEAATHNNSFIKFFPNEIQTGIFLGLYKQKLMEEETFDFVKEKFEEKKYDLSFFILEEAIRENPGNNKVLDLNNELRKKYDDYNDFLNEHKRLTSLYDQKKYEEALLLYNKVNKNSDYMSAISSDEKRQLRIIRGKIYKDGKNKIAKDSKNFSYRLYENSESEFEVIDLYNIFDEYIFGIFIVPWGTAVDAPEKYTDIAFEIFFVDGQTEQFLFLFLIASKDIEYSDTKENVITFNKREYPKAKNYVAKAGNIIMESVNGIEYEVVIEKLVLGDYWFEELEIAINIQ